MRRLSPRIFASIVGLTLVMTILAACGAGAATTTKTSSGPITIEIGSEFPTTGSDESSGKPAQNGVDLAIQQANASNFLPGYKFALVAKNDVSAASQTHDATVGQQNVTDLDGDAQVAGIVGPLNSSVALTEIPTTNRAPIALISPANTNNCLTKSTPAPQCGGKNDLIPSLRPTGKVTYFRTATLDQYQGAALALYAYQTLKFKSVYVIDDTETYGVGLAQNFSTYWTKLGGSIVGSASVKVTNSYENILTAAAAKKPDFIMFGGNDSTGGITIRQQMKSIAGLQNTVIVAGDGAQTTTMAKDIKPLGGGAVYTSIPGIDPSKSPGYAAFFAAYTKAFGASNFGSYSAGGYDDANILLQAIKTVITAKTAAAPTSANADASAFRQAVIDAVQKIKYVGLTGTHSFDANGDTTNHYVSLYTISDDVTTGTGWKFLDQIDTSSLG
jgi:branched-chain amino acid transport system substrate-binding protein